MWVLNPFSAHSRRSLVRCLKGYGRSCLALQRGGMYQPASVSAGVHEAGNATGRPVTYPEAALLLRMPVLMRWRIHDRAAYVSHGRMCLANHDQMPAQSFRRAGSATALLVSSSL